MKIVLPVNTFSFFKAFSSFIILFASLIFPVIAIISLVILVVGRAHTFGAWLAMWRAGKLTWKYLFWVVLIVSGLSFWGFTIASLETFGFVAYLFFAIHFMFDEFDLQEEKRTGGNILSSVAPTILTFMLLVGQFFKLPLTSTMLMVIAGACLTIEMLFIKEINWFFIHTKVLTLFLLVAYSYSFSATSILNIFLMSHYLFWFIYPVYKIHKYNREERDSFIMMLLIVMALSVFVYSASIWGKGESIELTLRSFYLASLTHVLLTAPFGYLFGLPKPRHH